LKESTGHLSDLWVSMTNIKQKCRTLTLIVVNKGMTLQTGSSSFQVIMQPEKHLACSL
jgi:hypothetical protein